MVFTSIVAWPVTAFLVAVAAFLIFRKPLTDFIDRIRSAKTPWSTLDASGPEQPTSLPNPVETPPATLIAMFDNQLLIQAERLIVDDPRLKAETNPAQRERGLIRHLAAAQLRAAFEVIYRIIFGTQLHALRFLAGQPTTTRRLLVPFYKDALTRYPETHRGLTFDLWFGFLVSANLVTTSEEIVSITLFGREFLKYLVDNGYPDRLG